MYIEKHQRHEEKNYGISESGPSSDWLDNVISFANTEGAANHFNGLSNQ